MKRHILKLMHILGATGVIGSLVAYLVLMTNAAPDPAGYAAVREGIAVITGKVLLPSMMVCLVSGLFALVSNRAYMDAGWPWLKALTGLGLVEGTLLLSSQKAQPAAKLARKAVDGDVDPARMAVIENSEAAGVWFLLAIALLNVVVAIWRPRFGRQSPSGAA
jgi:hypothetical protein